MEARPPGDQRVAWARGMTGDTGRGVAACLVAAVLFGVTVPLSAPILDRSGPLPLAGLLYLGAALVALPAAGRWRGWRPRRAETSRLAVAVVLGGAVAPVLVLTALQHAPSATVSLLLNLEVAATAVLAVTLFHDHLPRRGWLGIALVVAAGAVLAGGPEGAGPAALLVLLACVCWGLDNNLTAALDGIAPARITAVKGVVAGSANLVLGVVAGQRMPSMAWVLAALALGAAGYGASIMLWIAGARLLGAARGQALFATAPFWGVAAGWAMGGAVLAAQLVAIVLAATGVALTIGGAHRHLHRHQPTVHVHTHAHDDPHHAHGHEAAPGQGGDGQAVTGDGHDPLGSAEASDEGRHRHAHVHEPMTHEHGHLPDAHHRHDHPTDA